MASFKIGRLIAVLPAIAAGLVLAPATAAPRPAIGQLAWTPFKDEKLGFAFAFPAKVFEATPGDPTEPLQTRTQKRSGQVFRSRDGKAFLQTAAFANFDVLSVAHYKVKVAASYRDAKIEYERITPQFFVLSGVRGTGNNKETFYERVHFTCGGRVISAWSMTYPFAEGALYDRIVEEFARSYRPALSPQLCS